MIRKLINSDKYQTAKLHQLCMADDFLPSFGLPFLTKLHGYMIDSTDTVCLASFDKNILEGFIIGSFNTRKMMRQILAHHFLKLAPYLITKVLINPPTIILLVQTLFYGKQRESGPPAELIIICVSEPYRHQHIGTKLIAKLQKKFKELDVCRFKVGTLKMNTAANSMYKKFGGQYIYTFKMYNSDWNVYYIKFSE